MKNLQIFLISILIFGFVSIAPAQNCNAFSMSKGMILKYENYDASGNLTVKSINTCVDVRGSSSEGFIYDMTTTVFDANDAPLVYREYEMECEDGQLNTGIGGFTDPELLKEDDQVDISIDTTGVYYPEELSEGLTLPDATITLKKVGLDGNPVTYKVKITNRKVIGIESVTVPAGTFDCYKISYDIQAKGLFKKKYTIVEYFSEGVGKVKNENYTQKGKLSSSSQLVQMKK